MRVCVCVCMFRSYGLGREVLPATLAVPLATVAKKLEYFPFLDYAQVCIIYFLESYCKLALSSLTMSSCLPSPHLPSRRLTHTYTPCLPSFVSSVQAYSLNNWYLEDEAKGLVFENMRTIRKFHGGNDEQGFVLIHAAMVCIRMYLCLCVCLCMCACVCLCMCRVNG